MKQISRNKSADYFIKYDNAAPTAWVTIAMLLLAMLVFGVHASGIWLDNFIAESEAKIAEIHFIQKVEASEIERNLEAERLAELAAAKEQERQLFLAELRKCESTGNDFAKGDSGKSIGPYQWQKPTLEDYLGRKVSYGEYYSIVTNYEKIHPITYDTYFVKGESWRWKNCTRKINNQKTWNI